LIDKFTTIVHVMNFYSFFHLVFHHGLRIWNFLKNCNLYFKKYITMNLEYPSMKVIKYLVPSKVLVVIGLETFAWINFRMFCALLLPWVGNFVLCCLPYKQLWQNGDAEIKVFIHWPSLWFTLNFNVYSM
jgi:hypothetical protein